MGGIKENFGDFLKKIRKENDLTLKQLEKKVGISYSHLSRVERNKRTLSPKYIKKIAKELDLDENLLLKKAGYPVGINEVLEFVTKNNKLPDNISKETLVKYINRVIRDRKRTKEIISTKKIPVIKFINNTDIEDLEDKKTIINYKPVHKTQTMGLKDPIFLKVNKFCSTLKDIKNNDLILIEQTNEISIGKINLIYTKEQGVMLKRVLEIEDKYLIQGGDDDPILNLLKKDELKILGVAIELKRTL